MRADLVFIAAIINVISPLPYAIDAFRGKTHPNLVTWSTWTLLNAIAAAAAWSAGAHQTAVFMSAATIATLTILVAGLRYGLKRYTRFDVVCQAAALLGLALWGFTSNPALAVVINLVVDFAGLLPTIRHAWEAPHAETWQSFAISMVAGTLALISIQQYSFIALAMPLYILCADTTLTSIILSRRRMAAAVAK